MIAFSVFNASRSLQAPRVLIAHVPYRNRGGEEHHVETLYSIYESLGWKPQWIPESRDPFSFGSLDIARSLSRIQTQVDLSSFNLIHLHNLYPVLGPAFLRKVAVSQVPTVWTVHNHRFYCTNGLGLYRGNRCEECKKDPSLIRPILRNCNDDRAKSTYYSAALNQIRRENLLAQISRFIAPSPYIAQEIQEMGVSSDRIVVMPNPVFNEGEISHSETAVSGRKRIVFAGRLSREKGVEVLPGIARELPEYDIEVFGDGPELALLRSTSDGLPNFKLRGSVSHVEIIRAMQTASAGILPSICNEICPTFAIEALASGLPVYLVETPSTRWLIERFGAIGVKRCQIEEFAQKIRAQPPVRISSTLKSQVHRIFSRKSYAENLQVLLDDLRRNAP